MWKPDFTQTNPWPRMPPDYAGVATFIPTIENPLPPWDGNIGAEVIPTFNTPEYDALAQRIIEEARVLTQTGTPEEQARAERIISSGDRSTLVRAGIAQEEEEQEEEEAEPESVVADDGGRWGLAALVAVAVLAMARRK